MVHDHRVRLLLLIHLLQQFFSEREVVRKLNGNPLKHGWDAKFVVHAKMG